MPWPTKKLGKKISKFLFGYNVVEEIPGSYNKNFKLKRIITHSLWHGKISISLQSRGVDFKDLNNRAFLAFRLSEIVKAGLPKKSRITPINRIVFPNTSVIPTDAIDDNMFITKFEGDKIEKFLSSHRLSDIKNLNQMFENFVFNLWIGNYDKKDNDYVVNNKRIVFSIDYQLLGPGFKSDDSLALGANAWFYNFDKPEDTGCCLGKFLIDELKNNKSGNSMQVLQPMFSKIKEVNRKTIKKAMNGLTFYRESTKEIINDIFIDFLMYRKDKLEIKIKDWIKMGYPRRV